MQMDLGGPCELCEAANQEAFRTVHKDEHIATIICKPPVKDGHVLIIPLRHVQHLADLEPVESKAFLRALDRAADAIADCYDESPVIHVNGWGHRTQRHLHAHVLPSKEGLRGLFIASERLDLSDDTSQDELERQAKILRPFIQS